MSATPQSALLVAPAPRGVGGLGGAVAQIQDGFSQIGLRTEYATSPPPSLSARVGSTRAVNAAWSGAARQLQARDLRRATRTAGWDLVYAVAGSVPSDVDPGATLVIHQSTHFPTVELARLETASRATGGRADLARREARRRLRELERATLIHVTTPDVYAQFVDRGFAEERLVLAPLGVDLSAPTVPKPRHSLPRIAFIGPMSMRKGVDVLADLERALRGSATFAAIGGPTCRWSRRIADSIPLEHEPTVARLLGGADLFVLPSRSDAFALTVLEALAAGAVPIVTPEVGASAIVREIDPGLVLPLSEFVPGVAAIAERPDLDTLRRRGEEIVRRFERGATGRATAAALTAAAARLGRSRG